MWWIFKKNKHLPPATGPYVPGYMDVMTEYSVKGLFMTLYYPTDCKEIQFERGAPWMPGISYILGIAKLIMVYPLVVQLMMWFYSAVDIRIPSIYGAKISNNHKEKFKCIVFSHGLGAYRYFYSNICCELASRGFVVACVEHRDNSACHTYYYQSEVHAKRDIRTPIDFKVINFGKHHYENRNEQVHHRSDECIGVLDFLANLEKGTLPTNIIEEVPTNKTIEFKLEHLKGRIDLDNFMIGGHSFGAATALLTLSRRKDLKAGILFDPWMFPIKTENVPEKVDQPLLFVNTQTFHIEANIKAMAQYLEKDNREMYTIKHTTHENHSDSVLVFGYWLNWFMKKLDPEVALRINNCLVLRFLNERIGYPRDVSHCKEYLGSQDENIECGLTRPWA